MPRTWVQVGTNSAGDIMHRRHYTENDAYYEDLSTTGAAAELASELGVDLSQVKGTGKGGRITKADVEAAAE